MKYLRKEEKEVEKEPARVILLRESLIFPFNTLHITIKTDVCKEGRIKVNPARNGNEAIELEGVGILIL